MIKVLWRQQDVVQCHILDKQSLHCLSSDPIIKREWIKCIFNKDPERVSKNLVICSLHFTADLFMNTAQFDVGFSKRLKLKDDVVLTIFSIARYAVLPWNWATLTLLPGLEATSIMWYLWNVTFTRGTPLKNVYFTPRNVIFKGIPPSKRNWASFGLVLRSNLVGIVLKTWKPWLYWVWQ